MTAKQKLREHVAAAHGKLIPKSWTMDDIAHWHRTQHHRYTANHYHAGSNTGPGDRPPGWTTGEDAVYTRA